MARARTIFAWSAITLLGLIALSVLLVLMPAVQTAGARYALRSLNDTMAGKIQFDRIHVSLTGRFSLRGLLVTDETGREVLALDSLDGRIRLNALRRDSVHILDLSARGLTLDILVDSSGTSNFQRAMARKSLPRSKTTSEPLKWVFRLDQAHIAGGKTSVRTSQPFLFAAESWTLVAAANFAHDSLRYDIRFNLPDQVSLDASGAMLTGKEFRPLEGKVSLKADSIFTGTLPPPANVIGSVAVNADYFVTADSLNVRSDFASILGKFRLQATVPYPLKEIAGRAEMEFADATLTPFLTDSIKTLLNGHASIVRTPDKSLVNGWSVALDLESCRYGEYALISATLAIQTKDSIATLSGGLDTGHGTARVNATLDGFDWPCAHFNAEIAARNLNLHALLLQVPDSLTPVTAELKVNAVSLDTARPEGDITLYVAPLSLGCYSLDTLFLTARIKEKTYWLDTLHTSGMGVTISGNAVAERGQSLRYSAQVEAPDLAHVQSLLHNILPPTDSLSGAAFGQISGIASLTGDSLSHLTAAGFIELNSLQYGQYSIAYARLEIDSADLDQQSLRGSLRATDMNVAGQRVDSVHLRFDGTPQQIAAKIGLWAKADTIALTADLTAQRTLQTLDVSLKTFTAQAYGIPWQSAGESTFRLRENRLEIDGLELRSPVGVLRAVGTLERGGEQDLVVELSGFRTGEIARVFKLPIPESWVNARLQFTGPDSALTGDISVVADSVVMDGSPLADEIVFHATVNVSGTTVDGFLIWLDDTLTVFEGELPAHISRQRGFFIADSLPIRGHVRVLSQSMQKLNRYLPFGSTLEGTISADVTFTGTPAKPRWSGVFAVANGRYHDSRYGVDYHDIVIEGELITDTLRIPRFNAKSEGTLTGSGWAVMTFPLPSELHLDLAFDKFEAINGPMMRGRASGRIAVNGPLTKLNADGQIELSEVLYRITQATSKQVEEVDLKAEIALMRGDTAQAPFLLSRFYHPMSHRLRIELPSNCWVRGGGVNLELQGGLWLYKDSGEAPTINGEVTVREGGGVEFLGRELRVLSGSVRYEGPIDDPTVDIVAYLPRPPAGVDSIVAHVQGSLLRTRIELRGRTTDGNEMSPEQIVQQLLASGVNLLQSDSVSIAGKMENVLTTAASSQLSGMVGRLAGLDVFEFHPGEGGLSDLTGGSLEVGTYVTERLFVQVLQPIKTTQTGQKVSIEYRLLKWLKLRAQQTGRESSAFDLYLQMDWR
jgi:hypothetical protein